MVANLLRSLYYRVPLDLRHGILVRSNSARWIRTGVVFIHIPKAAGISINEALFGRSMGHARACDIARWGSDALKAVPSFAVTRNPWDRLVSAYRFARRGRGVGGTRQSWVWRPEQYQIPEFESFESFVNEWLAPRDIRTLDPIFQPQSLFTCDDRGRVLVDHVGKLEDLAPTLDFLEKTLGWRPDIPQANRSGDAVDYRSFYTPELTSLVGQIYRQDVELFRYDF